MAAQVRGSRHGSDSGLPGVREEACFRCALDWPGWCRSAKNEEAALEALAVYVPRYAHVAELAGASFPATVGDAFDVVERLPGNATTDFGAPAMFAAADSEPVAKERAGRFAALLRASWTCFDGVLAARPRSCALGRVAAAATAAR